MVTFSMFIINLGQAIMTGPQDIKRMKRVVANVGEERKHESEDFHAQKYQEKELDFSGMIEALFYNLTAMPFLIKGDSCI